MKIGMSNTMPVFLCVFVLAVAALLGGCTTPDKANIALRKENRQLRDQIAELDRRHDADQAERRRQQSTQPVLPMLPSDRLESLFTVHGLSFGRLTAGADWDPSQPGEDGLKIYVVPVDRSGQPLKAAGSFVVEAFDLSRPQQQKIGHWEFPLEEAAKNWFGQGLLYTYVLACPWQTRPISNNLVTQVTFVDGLTGRAFVQRREVKVHSSLATQGLE